MYSSDQSQSKGTASKGTVQYSTGSFRTAVENTHDDRGLPGLTFLGIDNTEYVYCMVVVTRAGYYYL